MIDSYSHATIPYSIPVFYHYKPFRDLNLSYFLGVGVSDHQIDALMYDFINLALISMYVYNFRNPLFFRTMKKVFWQYPSEYDTIDKWKRLEPNVIKQTKWFQCPYGFDHEKFKAIREILSKEELKQAIS